jgi:hypothetical protein
MRLRLPGASRRIRLFEIQALVTDSTQFPPPSPPPPTPPPPTPPPPLEALEVAEGASLEAALAGALFNPAHAGKPVTIGVGGTQVFNRRRLRDRPPSRRRRLSLVFDGSVTSSSVAIEASPAASLQGDGYEPIFVISEGSPPVHLIGLRILGRIKVSGGTLYMRDCNFTAPSVDASAAGVRGGGLLVEGGQVEARRTSFEGLRADEGGAIAVSGGELAVYNSSLTNNHAMNYGGALHVSGASSHVIVVNTRFYGNIAGLQGGAMFIASGTTRLADKTFLRTNVAVQGASIYNQGGSLGERGERGGRCAHLSEPAERRSSLSEPSQQDVYLTMVPQEPERAQTGRLTSDNAASIAPAQRHAHGCVDSSSAVSRLAPTDEVTIQVSTAPPLVVEERKSTTTTTTTTPTTTETTMVVKRQDVQPAARESPAASPSLDDQLFA